MKKILSILFLFSSFTVLCQKTDSEVFKKLIIDYDSFKSYDSETFPLGDFSEERFKKEFDFFTKIKNQLIEISSNNLSEDEKISYKLLEFVLKNKISDYEFLVRYNPILSDSGFHNSLVYNVNSFSNKKDVINYLNLLKTIPLFVEQNIKLIQKGIDIGISQPKIIFNGYEGSYEQHITKNYNNNFYYKPFLNLPENIKNPKRDSLILLAQKTINKSVIPSFKRIKVFFEKNYYPKTRKKISINSTPNGDKYYKNRISYYTTLNLTPKEIHEIGLEEVKKIRKKMEIIIQELEFDGSFEDFIGFLRSDSRFYAQSPRELLMYARDISKRLDEQLPRFFSILPRKPYGVSPVPDAIAPKYTGGRYIPSSPKSSNSAYYWVNTYNLSSRPLYTLPALSAHEAVPGHHLQIALNNEGADNIPKFRRNLYLSAYGEGWGLYAESLAKEMNIYTTPYERFGQLTYSMWRACRLVIDTGIHAFNWPKKKAVNFMLKNTALSIHEINTEIDRYISWPGQALSYKIGEIKIKELRSKSESLLGDKFDIRDFHNAILGKGTLTLPLMEIEVDNYIADKIIVNQDNTTTIPPKENEYFKGIESDN